MSQKWILSTKRFDTKSQEIATMFRIHYKAGEAVLFSRWRFTNQEEWAAPMQD